MKYLVVENKEKKYRFYINCFDFTPFWSKLGMKSATLVSFQLSNNPQTTFK